jgi:hypothetical protein
MLFEAKATLGFESSTKNLDLFGSKEFVRGDEPR